MKKVFIGLGVLIVGAVALVSTNPSGIFTPWLAKISRGPEMSGLATQKGDKNIPYSAIFTVVPPKPVIARQVSKLIIARLGGALTVTDAKGVVATLVVPAGAVKRDTTITMAPLQEVPIANFTDAFSNGVVIEPAGLQFEKNVQLTFDYKPTASASRASVNPYLAQVLALTSEEEDRALYEKFKNQTPEENEKYMNDLFGDAIQKLEKAGFPVNAVPAKAPAVSAPQPSSFSNGTKGSKNTLPKKLAVIHVDHNTGRVNVAETTHSVYGSKITATVRSLSSFPTVDMGGPAGPGLGQNDLQNGAADAGGACTPSFINAMLRVASWQMATGAGGEATAMQAVEDCGRSAFEEMKQRCEADPQHVTRREMLGLIQLLQQLGVEPEAEQSMELMQTCKRIYSVYANVDVPVPEGKSTYGINAQLCGYLDEQWVGTEIADYTIYLTEGWTEQVYTGDIRFTLPHGGGQFQTVTRGNVLVTGRVPRINVPETVMSVEGDGQIGNYDGNKQVTIFYSMFGHVDVPMTIEITKQQCESTNEVLEQSGM
ncbi:MAG: hypothetical protein Q7R85_04115 [bacterium]|nr:hypothetical protein [bacterium]